VPVPPDPDHQLTVAPVPPTPLAVTVTGALPQAELDDTLAEVIDGTELVVSVAVAALEALLV